MIVGGTPQKQQARRSESSPQPCGNLALIARLGGSRMAAPFGALSVQTEGVKA
jgi:hypothetical protein